MKIKSITLENENGGLEDVETALAACEETIQHGLGTFIEVGSALLKIREERLYRKMHRNFDEYCRKRWSFGKTHANRLVSAALASHELAPIGAISHESQIRPLLRLEPGKQQEAWREALKTNPAPTERQVKLAVQKLTPRIKRSVVSHSFDLGKEAPEIGQESTGVAAPSHLAVVREPADYDARCNSFFSLGIDELRDLIDQSDWVDMREALLCLRENLERCCRILEEGRRQYA